MTESQSFTSTDLKNTQDNEDLEHKSDSDSDMEDDGANTGLIDNSEDVSNSLTTPSRGRQMNAENLDGKIVKALKKQEEKRDKRAQRKKEVRLIK